MKKFNSFKITVTKLLKYSILVIIIKSQGEVNNSLSELLNNFTENYYDSKNLKKIQKFVTNLLIFTKLVTIIKLESESNSSLSEFSLNNKNKF